MAHHEETGQSSIFGHADYCWYVGSNIPGKKSRYLLYCNSVPAWLGECQEALDRGFDGFVFDGSAVALGAGSEPLEPAYAPIEGAPTAAL